MQRQCVQLFVVEVAGRLCLPCAQASAKGVPPALAQLRQAVATQLQPPSGFQQELASQAEQGGLIAPGDWSQGSDKWAHAWSAICQVWPALLFLLTSSACFCSAVAVDLRHCLWCIHRKCLALLVSSACVCLAFCLMVTADLCNWLRWRHRKCLALLVSGVCFCLAVHLWLVCCLRYIHCKLQ